MTDLDLHPLQSAISKYAQKGRPGLLPALFAAQELYGYIPERAAVENARELCVPLADVYGVIEFYALFHSKPVTKTVVHVCNDPACALAGSEELLKVFSTGGTRQDTPSKRLPVWGCANMPLRSWSTIFSAVTWMCIIQETRSKISGKNHSASSPVKTADNRQLRQTPRHHAYRIYRIWWIRRSEESAFHAASRDCQ